MIYLKRIIAYCIISLLPGALYAQVDSGINRSLLQDSTGQLSIQDILIKGNKKTKNYIILREVPFTKEDRISIESLGNTLEKARQLVYNTTLFSEVKIETQQMPGNNIIILITVKERWYVYPIPQFQLVDRNFNEWIKVHKASLDRVNYGVKFTHYNLSGRRDQLRVYLLNGYSRNIAFSYTAPYSNSKLTEGFIIGAGFVQNREIAYKTNPRNKLLFYPPDSIKKGTGIFVRNSFNINAGYIIRKGYYSRHIFGFSYNYIKVQDSVVLPKYNPNYFNSAKNSKGFPELSYAYQYVNVNNVAYPLTGKLLSTKVLKRGTGFTGGINLFQLEASYSHFFDLGKKWYASSNFYGKIKLPFEQAYINQRGFGYDDIYMRGLEYYVIDGVAAVMARHTLKKKLFSFSIPVPFRIKAVPKIPFTFFAKTFGDLGYVYNKNAYRANLNNKLLYSGGFGIDILTLYDLNLRFEYSFNQLHENGLFLHTQGGF